MMITLLCSLASIISYGIAIFCFLFFNGEGSLVPFVIGTGTLFLFVGRIIERLARKV